MRQRAAGGGGAADSRTCSGAHGARRVLYRGPSAAAGNGEALPQVRFV